MAETKNQHISSQERAKWNAHVGASGTGAHPLANGTTPGFSTNNFTTNEKNILATLNTNVGGVRLTINTIPPSNPVINKELWINLSTAPAIAYIYKNTGWEALGAFFS